MAENELLDISNPYIYRKWRQLIASGQVNAHDAAETLYGDFSAALHRALRKEPLSQVFAACGKDKTALQAAVAACKDRELAKHVEHACKIAPGKEPSAIAAVVADLMIRSLVDQCIRHTAEFAGSSGMYEQHATESATRERFEGARSHIEGCLTAALEGKQSLVPKPARQQRPSAEELLNTSLVPTPRRNRETVTYA